MSRRPRRVLTTVVLLIAIFLIAPTVVVMVMSFSSGRTLHFPPVGFSLQWYENFFKSAEWHRTLWMSLKVGLVSTALATVLGVLAALGFVRGRFPMKGLVTAIVISPFIVPGIVVAVGMYLMYVRWGLQGTMWGLVCAHTSLGIPLVTVNVVASLQNFDRNLEMAAQNLGAGPIRTFLRITLPLILPGVIAGALFAFITSWDEVTISIFLASPVARTVPVMMWSVVRSEVDPTIAALASILSVVTILLLVVLVVVRRLGSKT
jgi:putative spermidine/putrescine transport system permease protein